MRRFVATVAIVVLVSSCARTVTLDRPDTTVTPIVTTAVATTTTGVPVATVSTVPGMPDVAAFEQDLAGAERIGGDSFLIDPAECAPRYWTVSLTFGSSYVVTAPTLGGSCDVWFGGEMENPEYSGLPATYCRFGSSAPIVLVLPGNGGPIGVDDPACGPTGFPQRQPPTD